jgi:hypothetical protein
MSRNTNLVHNSRNSKKLARVLRPIRGCSAAVDEVAGVEKFKSDRRQARRQWRKEDEKYSA